MEIQSPRAFVEIESPLARAFVAFYSMIYFIVLFCVTMVICYKYGLIILLTLNIYLFIIPHFYSTLSMCKMFKSTLHKSTYDKINII